MDIKRLIILIIAAILFLSIIFGIIFSLYRLIRSRQASTVISRDTTLSQLVSSPVPQTGGANPSPTPLVSFSSAPAIPSNTKSYNLGGLQISYPKEWGILTCRNSQNIELDPTNGVDQLNLTCDRAVKPITIQTSFLTGCPNGQTVNLGGQVVAKVISTSSSGTDYKWCVNSPLRMEITHRVSQTDLRSAFSKTDYSQQIEQLISSFRMGGGS